MIPHIANAKSPTNQDDALLITLHKKTKLFFVMFTQQFNKNIINTPSFDVKKYEIIDEVTINKKFWYQNDLNIEERALYDTMSDLLNDLEFIKTLSEKFKKYSNAEIGFITSDTIANKKLSLPKTSPEPPNPKVEMGFGEQAKKRVRLGLKFDSFKSIQDGDYSLNPLIYLKLNFKLIRFQARYHSLEDATIFEIATSHAIKKINYSTDYNMTSEQLGFHISKSSSPMEIRLDVGMNVTTHDLNTRIIFFIPFGFN